MDEITKIETIDQYDQLFGLETLHPLVNVIDFSKATKTVEYYHMNIGFYSLFLKDINCGDLKYGRNYYDYQEGTVVCMAPGQVIGIDNRKKTPQRTKSIGVLFHPDLIRGTSLGQNIKNYSFFSYEVNEALHLSEQEALTEGLPSVKYFADKVCLSPNYFGDLIKKETGKTAQEYIQCRIIELAKERILEGSQTVSQIAYELGFQYPQHFSRLFKKHVGYTPNEYKQQN